jgi:hypothetical protein
MDGDSKPNLESMTIDDLLTLREQVNAILYERLDEKRAELDRRLQALAPALSAVETTQRPRRR